MGVGIHGPFIWMRGEDGPSQILLQMEKDGPEVCLMPPDGRRAVKLRVDKDGLPHLELADASATVRAELCISRPASEPTRLISKSCHFDQSRSVDLIKQNALRSLRWMIGQTRMAIDHLRRRLDRPLRSVAPPGRSFARPWR